MLSTDERLLHKKRKLEMGRREPTSPSAFMGVSVGEHILPTDTLSTINLSKPQLTYRRFPIKVQKCLDFQVSFYLTNKALY